MRKFMLITLILTLLSIPLPAAGQDGPRRADFENVPYVPDGTDEQVVDIYLPTTGEAPYPAIAVHHALSFDDSIDWRRFRRMALLWADRGYVVFNFGHRTGTDLSRLAPQFDAFCSMAWLHAHAEEYEVDRELVFTWGQSLGSYYAALVSYAEPPAEWTDGCPWPIELGRRDPWVAGMVSIAGVISTGVDPNYESLAQTVGVDPDTESELAAQLDPAYWIDSDDPPALLLHHRLDSTVTVDNAHDFAQRMLEAEVNVTSVIYANPRFITYHNIIQFDEPQSQTAQATLTYIDAFFTWQQIMR